jgi:hypothetical protein
MPSSCSSHFLLLYLYIVNILNGKINETTTSIAGYQLHKTYVCIVSCMYRPIYKNDDTLNQVLASINAARQALSTLKCSTMLLYGDFNFSHTSY